MCALCLGLLVGCTASWQAPVETRGAEPPAPRRERARISSDFYRVRRGDTLHGIAWQRGVDYRSIARWNGIMPPYRIYEGQVLRMKPRPSSAQSPRRPTVATARRPAAQHDKPTDAARAGSPPVTPPRPAPASPPAPTSPRSLAWRWPANGTVVSTYKANDTLRQGIKIAGRSGQAIHASEGGRVVYSGSGLIGYGRLIIVKHNDKYLSAYGHNRKLLVREGDQVAKGDTIAEMGTANGGDSLLHFEIRRDGKPIDPLRLLPRR